MKQNSVIRTIKYFLTNKKATFCALIMCTLGTICGIVTPILNKYLQEHIIANKDMSMFIVSTIIIIVVNFASLMSSYFLNKVFIKTGVQITSSLRSNIVVKNAYRNTYKNSPGELVLCGTGFMEETNQFYISYISLVFDAILKILFYLPFFIFYGRYASLIMLALIVCSLVVVELQSVLVKRNAMKSRKVDSERIDFTLKMYKRLQEKDFQDDENMNLALYKQKVINCDNAWVNYSVSNDFYPLLFNLVWYVGLVLCILYVFDLSIIGTITISTFIVFNSYVDQLKSPIGSIITYKQMADRMGVALDKIYKYTDEQ